MLCLPSLSSLLSLPSLDHFSLSLSSRLGLVILGWQWSASPGVVRFHPGLSPLLIVSLPPPTRVGTCLLFQVSSFKLLGLENPPCPPLPPRAALSRILGPLCWDTFHLPSLPPPSVWCERREIPTCARASWLPPLTLSPNTCLPHRIIPSLHLPPCVCV